ncbi:MAG: hypothetical protein SFZ23_02720 [Planctomycetota bacterium]|nr:hypothetical protein [Planctomycetota bacterium]
MSPSNGAIDGAAPRVGSWEGTRREAVARELGGDLPCVRCRYNLKGLSVRAVCSECGLPVRATLLAVVDPYASELQAIRHPRLTWTGLMAWSFGAVLAALAAWALRLSELLDSFASIRVPVPTAQFVLLGGTLISFLGSLSLLSPHERIPRGPRLRAFCGVAAFVPILLSTRSILLMDSQATFAANALSDGSWQRDLLRIVQGLGIGLAVWGLAPIWKMLMERSHLMRTGRREGQPLMPLAGVALVGVTGDVIHVLARDAIDAPASLGFLAGTLLVGVSAALLTLGFLGVALTCMRIRRVVLAPPLSLAELLAASGPGAAAVSEVGSKSSEPGVGGASAGVQVASTSAPAQPATGAAPPPAAPPTPPARPELA